MSGIRARRSALGLALSLLGLTACQPRLVELTAVSDSATAVYRVGSLTVIHRLAPTRDVVAARLYLLGGTRQLTAGNAGIEVLLLNAAQLDDGGEMAGTGSRALLEATPDWTVVGFIGVRRDLDSAWAWFARQLRRPSFSDTALERARGELTAGARRRYTQPDLRIHTGARQAAFAGHPYVLDPEGTEESLASLSRADLLEYWEREFVTSRMLLVVVGAVERAALDSMVATAFGRLPAGGYTWTRPPVPAPRAPRWLAEHQDLQTNYILGYFRGPYHTEDDYFAFRVAVHLLSLRLHAVLREERALSYAAFAPFLDLALPIGGVYVSTSRPAEAIGAVDEALQGMAWPVPRSLWLRAMNPVILGETIDRMTSDGQAAALARAHLFFGDVSMADEFVRHLRKVTSDEVVAAAVRFMEGASYAFMGDTSQMRGKWSK